MDGDRIEIRDLRVVGVHGVLPEERQRAQPFALDLDVWVDLTAAGSSDELADTVDYGDLVERAAAVVRDRSFQLLEALAADRRHLGARRRHPGAGGRGHAAQAPATHRARRGLDRRPGAAAGRGPVSGAVDQPGVRAFLGLGTNLGDRAGYLRRAVATLEAAGDVVAVSPLYETEPVGGPAGQGPYLNLVVELRTVDSPHRLLERCQALEQDAARVRTVRHGPRTLDADVLLVGDLVVDEPDLVVPHPRMWERRFVLAPLRDLAPELVDETRLADAGGDVTLVGML